MAHPGDNLNPFVVIGVLLVIVTILSCLIVWAAGPLPPHEPALLPADGGYIVTPASW